MNTVISFRDIDNTDHQLHSRLMKHSQGRKNDDLLACILTSWSGRQGGLPTFMGLDPEQFYAMLAYHYPGLEQRQWRQPRIRTQPDSERQHERNELLSLLLRDDVGESESENWIASIVSTACLAQNHLWQDLGLWSRKDLTRLLQENFPTLAARNNHNMKWKKFFYKQLCDAEGIYICRSPSCEVCSDFQKCFEPEE